MLNALKRKASKKSGGSMRAHLTNSSGTRRLQRTGTGASLELDSTPEDSTVDADAADAEHGAGDGEPDDTYEDMSTANIPLSPEMSAAAAAADGAGSGAHGNEGAPVRPAVQYVDYVNVSRDYVNVRDRGDLVDSADEDEDEDDGYREVPPAAVAAAAAVASVATGHGGEQPKSHNLAPRRAFSLSAGAPVRAKEPADYAEMLPRGAVPGSSRSSSFSCQPSKKESDYENNPFLSFATEAGAGAKPAGDNEPSPYAVPRNTPSWRSSDDDTSNPFLSQSEA